MVAFYGCSQTENVSSDQPSKSSSKPIPHLGKQGTACRLVVEGKPLEILSTFGEASLEKDAKAFSTLMSHIREVDSQQQTVVMIQYV